MSLRIRAIENMVDSEAKAHEAEKLHGHPNPHGHQGGVIGVVSGLGHALEDVLVAASRRREHAVVEDMTPEERRWREVAEVERKQMELGDNPNVVAIDSKVNVNPVSDESKKTKSLGIPYITQEHPPAKLFMGDNPNKAVPSNARDMDKVGAEMESRTGQPFKRDISHPTTETSTGHTAKQPSGHMMEEEEERPALSEFDRALDKLTGVFNNAHLMAEDIHKHPELARKYVKRSKSESQEGELKDPFEDALDRISSAYGSSNIRSEDRHYNPMEPRPRRQSERDAREVFDEALEKLTAPFNSSRMMAEDAIHQTSPTGERPHLFKRRSRESSENKDHFEDAIHKLTAAYGSTALQAEDVTHMDDRHHATQTTPPAAADVHGKNAIETAIDKLQDTLHKGIHIEDMPRYHWPEVRSDEKHDTNAHPISDAVKGMVTRGAEKTMEVAGKGAEKVKEAIPSFGTSGPKEDTHETYAKAGDFEEKNTDRVAVESIVKNTQPQKSPTQSAEEAEALFTKIPANEEFSAKTETAGPKTIFAGNQKLQVGGTEEMSTSPPRRGIFSRITGMLFGKKDQPQPGPSRHPVNEYPRREHGETVEKPTSDEALILT